MADDGLLCWNCGRPTGIVGSVTRMDSCDHCMADLRCCRGCRHFDPHSPHQCREHVDKTIRDKEKSNFCDFFSMRDAVKRAGGIHKSMDDKDSRKKKFDDLFSD